MQGNNKGSENDKRRRMPRLSYGLPVRYWSWFENPPKEGQTVNISPNGMFIKTDHNERNGRPLKLEINLPGRKAMSMEAVVVWNRNIPSAFREMLDNGFGVRIVQAPEEWYRLFIEAIQ